jgi:hypothetical protein
MVVGTSLKSLFLVEHYLEAASGGEHVAVAYVGNT